MRLRLSLLFGAMTLFSFNLIGGKVDETIARRVAVNWYRHYAPQSKKQAVIIKTIPYQYNGRECIRIFSFDKGGFVMVSANEAVTPVLGYGFDHTIPDSITNEVVKGWIDGYARQIDTAFVLNMEADASISKWDDLLMNKFPTLPGDAVAPLLTTTWDQGWPYNAYCPSDASGPGGHCVTGCVATAIGQIFKYHNYPPKGNGHIYYNTDSLHCLVSNGLVISANFDSTYYHWLEMQPSLSQGDTSYHAIAELLFHCGAATISDYSGSSTGGTKMGKDPLLDVFGFACSSLRRFDRSDFSPPQWDSVLISELHESRPVYYEGYTPSLSTGHAFVCDGYDQTGFFHFNFGWSGQGDGYYLTGIINPSWWTFNDNQSIITGIKPNDGSTIMNDSTFSGIHQIASSLHGSAWSRLTFSPGTILQFDSACNLTIAGSVISEGTSSQPVVFTAIDTVKRWSGLKINPSIYNYLMLSEPDTLLLKNTEISFSDNQGIDIQWPNFLNYHEQVIKKGVSMEGVHVFNNQGVGINGNMSGINADSCQIYKNGGGIKLDLGWLNVKNSSLQYNDGTAIYYHNQLDFFASGNSEIINNVICHNVNLGNANETPGGIYLGPGSYFDPAPVGPVSFITGNIISDNTGNPGGIRVHGNTVVNENKIFRNTATFYGGGGFVADHASFINNEVFNNNAGYGGGGLIVSDGRIINNLIYNNNSGIAGSQMVDATITNNTIINNGSGISFIGIGTMEIRNNIIWNQGVEINAGTNQVNVSRSIIKGGAANIYATTSLSTVETIIKRNPRFINPTTFIGTGEISGGLNWGVQLNSAAIDAAVDDTAGFHLPGFDANGCQRFNRTLDIGALENQSDTIFPCFIEDANNLNDCIGNPVNLSIPYRGENCQFEWYHNDSIDPGNNNDTLTLSSLSEADSGRYFCIISNSFGKDTSGIIRVNVFLLPPDNASVIHGHDTIYHFEKELTYWTNTIPNCTNSEWVASQGLSFTRINDTIIALQVDDTITSGFLKFFGHNPCGTSSDTAVFIMTVLPMPEILTISGDSSLCAGSSYAYYMNMYTVNFNFQYDRIEWQIPSEMDAYVWQSYGQMAIIYVDSVANSDTVYARWVKDNYGIGQWSPFPIRIFPPTLEIFGGIMGPDSVSLGSLTTYHVNHNPAVFSYEWIVPTGFNIISGQTSDSIMVFIDSTAQRGILKVKAQNECLESSYITDSVFISILPQQLCVAGDTVDFNQSDCYNAYQTITAAGAGNTFVVQPGGSVIMIAGQSIKFLSNTTLKNGAYLHGYIAPSGPWCITPSIPAVAMGEDKIPGRTIQASMKVYPNPTTGDFVLELPCEKSGDRVTVDIYGMLGEKVLTDIMSGEHKHEFSLTGKPFGVYLIHIIAGDTCETAKIIKQ